MKVTLARIFAVNSAQIVMTPIRTVNAFVSKVMVFDEPMANSA